VARLSIQGLKARQYRKDLRATTSVRYGYTQRDPDLHRRAIILVSRFLRTSYGHFAYAIGGNEKTAYFSGIPVERVKVTVYILAALLAGLAAVIFVGRVGMGDPRAGQWLPLDSIAAVTIGGASLSGGVGSVAGTVIGVLILGTLTNIMNLMGVPPTIQPAVKGIVIILAVYLNSRKKN
jgi:ribose/xylose/arabinose/galactoside ABC-type transport system permease subunit